MRAWGELDDYVDEMVARRRHTLTDDLLSDLIRAEDDGDRLNAAELRMLAGRSAARGHRHHPQPGGRICRRLLSTTPTSGRCWSEHPDWRRSAVEETMRHSPVGSGTLRTVTEDTEFAGSYVPRRNVPARQYLCRQPGYGRSTTTPIASTSAGRRARRLTFGGGIHYCLGANLARLELAEALKMRDPPDDRSVAHGTGAVEADAELSGPTTVPIEFARA